MNQYLEIKGTLSWGLQRSRFSVSNLCIGAGVNFQSWTSFTLCTYSSQEQQPQRSCGHKTTASLRCVPARTLKEHASSKTGNPSRGLASDPRQLMKRTEPRVALQPSGKLPIGCALHNLNGMLQNGQHCGSKHSNTSHEEYRPVIVLPHFANPC